MKNSNSKNLTNLRAQFDEIKNSHFPQVAPVEELQNMKGELALYDGHVAGLVSSYLKGAAVNPGFVKVNNGIESKVKNFHPKTPEEQKSIQELIAYKRKLDNLISVLSQLLTEPK